MNTLTQTQKDIIANLTNEFKLLNGNPTKPLNELMDIGALMSDLNNDKKQRKEIELSNEAHLLKLKETATNYSTQLCDLLRDANLVAWIKHHSVNSTIYIGTWYDLENEYRWHEAFRIEVGVKSKTTYFKSKIPPIGEYIDGCSISFYYDENHFEYVSSMEELLSNKYFISRIKNIIASANR